MPAISKGGYPQAFPHLFPKTPDNSSISGSIRPGFSVVSPRNPVSVPFLSRSGSRSFSDQFLFGSDIFPGGFFQGFFFSFCFVPVTLQGRSRGTNRGIFWGGLQRLLKRKKTSCSTRSSSCANYTVPGVQDNHLYPTEGNRVCPETTDIDLAVIFYTRVFLFE